MSLLLLLELSYNNVDFLLALFSVKQNHLGSQIQAIPGLQMRKIFYEKHLTWFVLLINKYLSPGWGVSPHSTFLIKA